jgi:hypothetical protein
MDNSSSISNLPPPSFNVSDIDLGELKKQLDEVPPLSVLEEWKTKMKELNKESLLTPDKVKSLSDADRANLRVLLHVMPLETCVSGLKNFIQRFQSSSGNLTMEETLKVEQFLSDIDKTLLFDSSTAKKTELTTLKNTLVEFARTVGSSNDMACGKIAGKCAPILSKIEEYLSKVN